MKIKVLSIVTYLLASGLIQAQYEYFQIPDARSLRGVASLSESECWVSGSMGKVFRTKNGGAYWRDISPEGFDSLDFRDIQVFNSNTAIIMSSGVPTRILKTINAGRSWKVVYESDDPRVFLDAMDFWDNDEGVVFGDAIGNKLIVLTTSDQGESWSVIDTSLMPSVEEGQGGFAASGSCLFTFGTNSVVIGLGGPSASIISSNDRGQSWIKSDAPLSAGTTSSGIFSFSFDESLVGLCVGGDYTSDSASKQSAAITIDGGLNWNLITDPSVNGYYHSSCLIIDSLTMVTISRYGSSWSKDGGQTWQRQDEAYFSLSGFKGGFWASGPKGKVARWLIEP